MGMKIRFAVSIMLVAFCASAINAQEPVKPAADVEALFKDNDKKLN
jgi:hypothetical protein